MTIGTLLNVIISMVFLYLAFAIFTSEFQEYLATIFEVRAKRLKQSIRKMLGEEDWPFYPLTEDLLSYLLKTDSVTGSVTSNPSYFCDILGGRIIDNNNTPVIPEIKNLENSVNSLTQKLYEHPNIKSLNQSSFAWWTLFNYLVSNNLWISIPAWILIGLIISLIIIIGFQPLWIINLSFGGLNVLGLILIAIILVLLWLGYSLNKNEEKLITKRRVSNVRNSVGPSYIGADIFAETLIDVLDKYTDDSITDKEERLKTLTFYTPAQAILRDKLKKFKRAKSVEAPTTQQLIDELTQQYKKEFEEVQKRSSGVYKRNAKGLSFLIGLFIAIMLNADTFYIVSNLTKENNDAANQFVTQLEQDPNLLKCPDNSTPQECLTPDKESQIKEIFKEIDTIPLGWNNLDKNADNLTNYINTTITNQGGWLRVIVGWIITAIAISMGAPFWFDLLNRIMNVRNAQKEDKEENKEQN